MTLHEEIAKERYLDRISGAPDASRRHAAAAAIEDATAFVMEYSRWKAAEQADSKRFVKSKGCPSCFGSGGKKDAPCRQCEGSGRVPA